jgi:hypothetical protein
MGMFGDVRHKDGDRVLNLLGERRGESWGAARARFALPWTAWNGLAWAMELERMAAHDSVSLSGCQHWQRGWDQVDSSHIASIFRPRITAYAAKV